MVGVMCVWVIQILCHKGQNQMQKVALGRKLWDAKYTGTHKAKGIKRILPNSKNKYYTEYLRFDVITLVNSRMTLNQKQTSIITVC